jgi:acyl dehydratase
MRDIHSSPSGLGTESASQLPRADFDDLAEGLSFTTRGRSITEADVVAFASMTGDMHPQHTDISWAAMSPFGGRIAHGMLVLSYAFGLMPFDPNRVVALRAVRNAVFKRPVALGDTIRVVAQVERLLVVDEATGLVTLRLDIMNQHARLVARSSVEVLWRRGRPELVQRMDESLELVGLPI